MNIWQFNLFIHYIFSFSQNCRFSGHHYCLSESLYFIPRQ